MPRDRTNTWMRMVVGCALATALLACCGPALLVRQGALPPFHADLQLWQGTTLTLHSTGADACKVAARCPHQIGIQPALSVWLIWQTHRRGNVEVFGRRLLYLAARR